jgi:antitoxin YefM
MKSAAINVTTFSEARANLKSVMDQVTDTHMPTVISRRKAEPVVMISLSTWNALNETEYLISSSPNAERLRAAKAAAERGEAVERELIEP